MKKLFTLLCLSLATFTASAIGTPRSEYPRPQFERAAWINLNGTWDFDFDFSASGIERDLMHATSLPKHITVPFCPESQLSGIGYKDFINCAWYHRTLDIPAEWDGQRILLHFGGVYYTSEIYIDGQLALRHYGGSSAFEADITPYVKAGQTHHLTVRATSDVRSMMQSAGKQSLRHGSYDCLYTRTTGIWQTVWMEAVAKEGLKDVQVLPDIDQRQLVIHPQYYAERGGKLTVSLFDGTKRVAQTTVPATNATSIVLPVKNMKLWSPESPFLYDLTYELRNAEGKVVDEVRSYVGMRKIHTSGNRVYLNNEPYYQRLVLDQGFYPDGIWTAPSDEALRHDIELSMAAGFNGARLHQKVFEDRFYYWADKMGYLTWSEAPSWGMACNNPVATRNFLSEWRELVVQFRNHPSIVTWTPLNEEFWPDGYEYPRFVADLYDVTKALDPTRPFNDASGGTHVKTDIWTAHHYEQDPVKLREILYNDGRMFQTSTAKGHPGDKNTGFSSPIAQDNYRYPVYDFSMPYILDEVGGIKWVKAAKKDNVQTESWGYGEPPKTEEEFFARLEGQIDAVLSLSDYIWGYCYTQLTDVEQEQNGVYFYDRSYKFAPERFYKIFSKTPQK